MKKIASLALAFTMFAALSVASISLVIIAKTVDAQQSPARSASQVGEQDSRYLLYMRGIT